MGGDEESSISHRPLRRNSCALAAAVLHGGQRLRTTAGRQEGQPRLQHKADSSLLKAEYLASLRQELEAIHLGLDLVNWAEVSRWARKKKDTAGTYGFGRIAVACEELHYLAKVQDSAVAIAALDRITDLIALAEKQESFATIGVVTDAAGPGGSSQ